MTTLELKTKFHKLIDNINNDDVLSKFYEMLSKANEVKEGSLWNRLTDEEQQELILLEKESHNPDNLTAHAVIKEKHKKWL